MVDDHDDVFNGDRDERWQTDTRWNVGEIRRRENCDLVIEEPIELVDIDLNARPVFIVAQYQINCVP